jgi:hypothetical protein
MGVMEVGEWKRHRRQIKWKYGGRGSYCAIFFIPRPLKSIFFLTSCMSRFYPILKCPIQKGNIEGKNVKHPFVLLRNDLLSILDEMAVVVIKYFVYTG